MQIILLDSILQVIDINDQDHLIFVFIMDHEIIYNHMILQYF